MRNVFIVLLIAALGAALYFFVIKRKPGDPLAKNEKLILGKWTIDSLDGSHAKNSIPMLTALLHAMDSAQNKIQLEFLTNGKLVEGDGKAKDTNNYSVEKETILFWSDGDSTRKKYQISKLDSTHMILQDKDSIIFNLSRVK
ncbi:MAG: hypothetical protein C4308_03090 [Chitinophagaceae bacterium]